MNPVPPLGEEELLLLLGWAQYLRQQDPRGERAALSVPTSLPPHLSWLLSFRTAGYSALPPAITYPVSTSTSTSTSASSDISPPPLPSRYSPIPLPPPDCPWCPPKPRVCSVGTQTPEGGVRRKKVDPFTPNFKSLDWRENPILIPRVPPGVVPPRKMDPGQYMMWARRYLTEHPDPPVPPPVPVSASISVSVPISNSVSVSVPVSATVTVTTSVPTPGPSATISTPWSQSVSTPVPSPSVSPSPSTSSSYSSTRPIPKPSTSASSSRPSSVSSSVSSRSTARAKHPEGGRHGEDGAPSLYFGGCFNCRSRSHRYPNCPEKRGRFCYRCGAPGKTLADCPNCSHSYKP